MDETDLSLFGGKKKSKQDKADATSTKTDFIRNDDDFATVPAEKQTILSRPTEDDVYDNSFPNIGIALIFNHKDIKGQKQRTGTEEDRDAMQRTLSNYGFDVRVFNDLTFEKISEQLKAVAAEDHSRNDCLVVVVMSHGTEGKVYARDMTYPVERLWKPFLGLNCKSLINKPKLFFIQACRGENLEKPVTYNAFAPMSREINFNLMATEEKPVVITYAIPNTADMLVMYSTFERYFSFRNVENGSWFIQSLCDVLNAAAKDPTTQTAGAELLRLLTAVNRKVAYEFQSFAKNEALNEMKEMPNFMSTLTKTFYLKVKRRLS